MLCVLLPGLVAGVRLSAAPAPGELARVQRAVAPGPTVAPDSEIGRLFHRATLPAGTTFPADAAAQAALLARARLAQAGGMAGVGLLLYLVVVVARGRVQALLACIALACLPPVALEGHVLRPETPSVLLAGLSLLLLQCLAQAPRRAGRHWTRAVTAGGLVGCAMLACGLAVATLPSNAASLLVPGVVLTVAAGALFLHALRTGRARGLARVPVRALNARLLPWTAAALMTPVVVLWLLSAGVGVPVDAVAPSVSAAAAWPAALPGRFLVFGLGALGAASGVVRAGVQLGRSGRITADLVLLVACAVTVVGAFAGVPGADRLPAAVLTAVLLADGARTLLVVLARLLRRRISG